LQKNGEPSEELSKNGGLSKKKKGRTTEGGGKKKDLNQHLKGVISNLYRSKRSSLGDGRPPITGKKEGAKDVQRKREKKDEGRRDTFAYWQHRLKGRGGTSSRRKASMVPHQRFGNKKNRPTCAEIHNGRKEKRSGRERKRKSRRGGKGGDGRKIAFKGERSSADTSCPRRIKGGEEGWNFLAKGEKRK